MRAVFGLVLIIGMGLAGFAVYLVNDHFEQQELRLQREQQRAASAITTVDVYAPSRDLTYGELITIDDVKIIKYPTQFLPEGVFKTEEELFPAGPDTPRVATLPMFVNEPVLAARVTEAGATRGLTALVEPGMRAFPISGRMASGFGDLRPNDRIDIYWTGRLRDGSEVTNLLKSGLQIIAVMGEGDSRSGPQSVVLQVTPEEVAILTQAQNSGTLTLSLFGAGDTGVSTSIQVGAREITGEQEVIQEEAPAPAPIEEKCYVTQNRGTERIEVEVECPTQR